MMSMPLRKNWVKKSNGICSIHIFLVKQVICFFLMQLFYSSSTLVVLSAINRSMSL